jgi:di/tricarboxylate transporter
MFVTIAVILVLIVVIMFVVYKGYKASGHVNIEDVEVAPVNKKTLAVLFTSLVIIVIPALIQLLVPNPVTKWMASNLGIQTVAAISSALMAVMKLADCGSVIKNRVPWNMIIMICGVTMLMGLVTPLGITDALDNLLSGGIIPIWLVVPALTAIFALLSFFVSGMVLQPLLVSFAPALMGIGISGATIITASQAGGIVSSLSPYSAAGAMAILGCPEEDRIAVSSKMIRYAILCSIIVSLLAFTGIYS